MTTPEPTPNVSALSGFFGGILVKVLTDPGVQAWVQNLAKTLIGDILRDAIAPLVPLAAASAAKALHDVEHDVETTVTTVGDTIATDLNNAIPGLQIPGLSAIVNIWKGITG